ncbi:aspartyl protease family protein [Flavobacterium sp. SM2513]|uniref:retropepsin-like aspartic protease n=1 Tax=Flavobacterium sp. SM2513 TaxID=3424766 RepID=UPI003D7F2BA0
MKIIITFCFSLVLFFSGTAQESFDFESSKHRIKLPFKLVNNLIILPVKVNGISLNFLVDTGIEETILFSLDDKKEIPLYDIEKIKLKGLGSQEPIEGLKAYRNMLSVKGLEFKNQEIVVILDQGFNFSSALGIEVNGIIGHHFFSQGVVKIDYNRKRIILYNPKKYQEKKVLSKFEAFDFTLIDAKPYISMQVQIEDKTFDAKCLIDSGNSDALWLFQGKSDDIIIPDKHIDDYLGRGFSGDVFGKKAKINTLSLANYNFQDVVTSFPDTLSFANLKLVDGRFGSIGGEFLRRFNVILDYPNQKLYLQKSKYYKDKFTYNTTGITVHHAGLQWYQEDLKMDGLVMSQDLIQTKSFVTDLKYNFKLIPIYEILNIRKNSTAEKVGLKIGDEILRINGNSTFQMKLEKINEFLKGDDKEEVTIVILRNGNQLTFNFKIVDLL